MQDNVFTDWERVFVATDGDKIVGFCTFTKEDGIPDVEYSPYIGYIFVDEAYRGQRLSEQMIETVISYAKNLQFREIYIVSDHIGLYEKYGFVKIDEKVDERGN
jgi:GNAT superfamily N-acetyltransferase